MRPKFATATIPFALLGCLVSALPGRAQTDDQEDEQRVVVDVQRATRPHVWAASWGGYLGVDLVELTPELRAHFGVPEDTGVMIGSVEEKSPAAAAGLQAADIITSIDGEPVASRRAVAEAISDKSGETTTVGIVRDGHPLELTAEIEQRRRPQLLITPMGEDGSYAFRWRSDGGGTVISPAPPAAPPPPGAPPAAAPLVVEPEKLSKIMEELSERLDSPEFKTRMLEIRSNTEQLEARIRELEQRLEELSGKLEKLEPE